MLETDIIKFETDQSFLTDSYTEVWTVSKFYESDLPN